ncbi:MAG: carboxypeptidase-like regulatory domain-containing protein [Armatimonadota bacterium]|nr:carboxypeptidase-like regulatory domain-containing protein [Armatimonadota bacterium]
MLRKGWLMGLFLTYSLAAAQTGSLRVSVGDEKGQPLPAIVSLVPDAYAYCYPWSDQILSEWHYWFLKRQKELNKQISLHEWYQWMTDVSLMVLTRDQWLTDDEGVGVRALSPDVYSAYAWSPGYGVACAHRVVVKAESETTLRLVLRRIPITQVTAQLVIPSEHIETVRVRLEQKGRVSTLHPITVSSYESAGILWEFPFAEWHPRAQRWWGPTAINVIFEADEVSDGSWRTWSARRTFVLDRLGEPINLGVIKLEPQTRHFPPLIPIVFQLFWADGKTPASGVSLDGALTNHKGTVTVPKRLGGHHIVVEVPRSQWHKGVSSAHWLYVTPKTKVARIILPRPARLKGVVRDDNGKPVAKAEVTIRYRIGDQIVDYTLIPNEFLNGFLQRTVTDPNGVFTFNALPPGSFVLSAWDGNTVSNRFMFVPAGTVVEVPVILEPERWRRLIGEVRSLDGEPVTNAVVVTVGKRLFTDPFGRFEGDSPIGEGALTVWSPDKGAAVRWVTIPPSDEPLHLSFTLETGGVQGRLVDEKGRPLPMEVVSIQRVGSYSPALMTTHTDEDGRFTISPVPSGEWQLVVEARRYYHNTLPALIKKVIVPPTGIVNVGTLTVLRSLGDVMGRVVFPKDFGKRVGEDKVQVVLHRDEWWSGGPDFIQTVTLHDPQFRFSHLPPGTYWLIAKGGGWASEPQKVLIPDKGGIVRTKVTIKRAGNAYVVVQDKKQGKALTAYISILHSSKVELGTNVADNAGEAIIKNLPPGNHTLFISQPLHHYVQLPITITPDTTTRVKVTLEPKL